MKVLRSSSSMSLPYPMTICQRRLTGASVDGVLDGRREVSEDDRSHERRSGLGCFTSLLDLTHGILVGALGPVTPRAPEAAETGSHSVFLQTPPFARRSPLALSAPTIPAFRFSESSVFASPSEMITAFMTLLSPLPVSRRRPRAGAWRRARPPGRGWMGRFAIMRMASMPMAIAKAAVISGSSTWNSPASFPWTIRPCTIGPKTRAFTSATISGGSVASLVGIRLEPAAGVGKGDGGHFDDAAKRGGLREQRLHVLPLLRRPQLHRGAVEVLLGGEVLVDRLLGDVQRAGQIVHRRAAVAVAQRHFAEGGGYLVLGGRHGSPRSVLLYAFRT